MRRLSWFLVALAVLVAACGGGGGSDGVDVATLATSTTAPVGGASSTDASTTTAITDGEVDALVDEEAAALDFAACVREEGVPDFPDPIVQDDGRVTFDVVARAARGEIDITDPDLQPTVEACGEILEGTSIAAQAQQGPSQEQADALLAFTTCLRDEGLDVGDFGSTQIDPAAGGTDTPRSPGDLAAVLLGQDPDDPAWQSAFGACFGVLATAFAGGT